MALIPPFMLDCVVAIGFDSPVGVEYNATGFLYGLPHAADANGRMTYHTVLVTNRHVFQDEQRVHLRFNTVAAVSPKVFPVDLVRPSGEADWQAHPDDDVDVAAITINEAHLTQEGVRHSRFLGDNHVLTLADADKAGVSEGQGVFVLGFPMGLVGAQQNYAVVRQGIIARIGPTIGGEEDDFLVDASVYPGNSGGPVVTRPEAVAITGTQAYAMASLVGIVCSYLPYSDVAVSPQTGETRVVFEENSGLARVVPVDRIAEVAKAAIRHAEARANVAALPQT